jgi:hypothetical protein
MLGFQTLAWGRSWVADSDAFCVHLFADLSLDPCCHLGESNAVVAQHEVAMKLW